MKTGIVSLLCNVAIGSIVLGCNTATVVGTNEKSVNRDPRFACVSLEPVTPLPADLRATLVAFGPRHPDDEYVAVSTELPGGFAGLFVENGRTVLLFVDPVEGLAARTELQSRLSARGLDYSRLNLETAEVRPARWTFAQLDEWFRYIVPRLRVDGLNSWDIDERANTISLGVVDEAAQVRVEAAIAGLNVSCNLVTTRVQGQIYAL
jgi:hypothetical protein